MHCFRNLCNARSWSRLFENCGVGCLSLPRAPVISAPFKPSELTAFMNGERNRNRDMFREFESMKTSTESIAYDYTGEEPFMDSMGSRRSSVCKSVIEYFALKYSHVALLRQPETSRAIKTRNHIAPLLLRKGGFYPHIQRLKGKKLIAQIRRSRMSASKRSTLFEFAYHIYNH